ncbi:LytTR family DNA-binding domain-containing protein [Aerococcaceae bacterium NML191219]|nr:LytTR family DNA-binding domain-containing protein [Aerococcaceae bacterium NML191219]
MYPIIICEDSHEQLAHITTLVNNYILFHDDRFKLVLAANSPDDVLTYLHKFQPKKAVYLLDVDLNHSMNGIDLAERIRKNDVDAKIIFITTHEEVAPLTIKRNLEATDFIEKGYSISKLRDALYQALEIAYERLTHSLTERKQMFIFNFASQTYHINLEDIMILETAGLSHKLVLKTINGEYNFPGNLSDYEQKYPQLFRISKSSLINPDNVFTIDYRTKMIIMKNKSSVPFSIRMTKKVKERFSNN